jgi:hypothetical protein
MPRLQDQDVRQNDSACRDDVRRMEMAVYHCSRCDGETTRDFVLSAGAEGGDKAGGIHLKYISRTAHIFYAGAFVGAAAYHAA